MLHTTPSGRSSTLTGSSCPHPPLQTFRAGATLAFRPAHNTLEGRRRQGSPTAPVTLSRPTRTTKALPFVITGQAAALALGTLGRAVAPFRDGQRIRCRSARV